MSGLSRKALRAGLAGLAGIAGLLALDALVIEPHLMLFHDRVRIPAAADRVRFVHLSDLHIGWGEPLHRRLLRAVAEAQPDVILLSGDLVRDSPDLAPYARHTAAATALVAQLRVIAPVYAVQGHSEYQGLIVSSFAGAGVDWLSNQGVRIGGEHPLLLLGLNQQVGDDAYIPVFRQPFRTIPAAEPGVWSFGARRGKPFKDFYAHYDPAASGSIAGEAGPLAWSGYEMTCDVRISGRDTGAGIAVHSRYVLGEDRMLRLRRVKAEGGRPGSFWLIAQGTTFTGNPDTGVDPVPGRWYRLRLRTEVEPGKVRLFAKVWPTGGAEPPRWQAEGEDTTPQRIEAGTVGLGAWGGGTVLYRNVQVTANDGRVLLADPLAGSGWPAGWRAGARGTRLAMALARSPEVPPGTPRVVLSHVPDVAPEAAYRGIEIVLAGHTHGGQVRLPFVGAVTTRSRIGPYFDHGLFQFAAPNRQGWTTLFVNSGFGTSLLPIRFLCPPRWAEVEVGGGR